MMAVEFKKGEWVIPNIHDPDEIFHELIEQFIDTYDDGPREVLEIRKEPGIGRCTCHGPANTDLRLHKPVCGNFMHPQLLLIALPGGKREWFRGRFFIHAPCRSR